MRDFLFDTPYWALGLLVIVAGVLWATGNSRQDRKLKGVGYGIFAIAVALALLSYFVDTDKEVVTKATGELVGAVEKRDKAVAERLLHPKVRLVDPEGRLAGMDKAAIVERVGTAADQLHFKDVRVSSLNVTPADANMIATFMATVTADQAGPVPTNWKLVWEKTDQGWQVREIVPLGIGAQGPEALSGQIKAK